MYYPLIKFLKYKHKRQLKKQNLGRVFAVGDVYGCKRQLDCLIKGLSLADGDTVVFLGNYMGKGGYSKEVVSTLIELSKKYNVVALQGSHERMMLKAFGYIENHTPNLSETMHWLAGGGEETLSSYDVNIEDLLRTQCFHTKPEDETLRRHLEFMASQPMYYETKTHIFSPAFPRLDVPLEKQDEYCLTCRAPTDSDAEYDFEHFSCKIIVNGSFAQDNNLPMVFSDYNYNINSDCHKSGWLTALDVTGGLFFQSNGLATRKLSLLEVLDMRKKFSSNQKVVV